MFKIHQCLKSLSLLVGLLILVICIATVEKKYAKQICKNINIAIAPTEGQRFIEENLILTYLTARDSLPLYNTLMQQIKTTKIENIIQSHNFVRLCSVYKTWKGSLHITILPKSALARITCPPEADRYIDEVGEILPLSASYTPRVLLLSSKKLCKLENNIHDVLWGKSMIEMLHLIHADPFWKAQIIDISIDDNDELTMSTQLSRHKIYFGKLDNIANKMRKLRLVYKVILPYKGWNAYKRITLKFDNQIACE